MSQGAIPQYDHYPTTAGNHHTPLAVGEQSKGRTSSIQWKNKRSERIYQHSLPILENEDDRCHDLAKIAKSISIFLFLLVSDYYFSFSF